jgi:hypothetical protein
MKEMLAFAAKHDIAAKIEVLPLPSKFCHQKSEA